MTARIQFLNDVITEDLLEEKIRENEANIQAMENQNNLEENLNSENKNDIKESSNSKDDINEIGNEKRISIKEEINNKELNNSNQKDNKIPTITPIKKEEVMKENENSSTSSKKLNNLAVNLSNTNNSNNKTNNTNISINNENKNLSNFNNNKKSKKISQKKNGSSTETRRNIKKKFVNYPQNNSNYYKNGKQNFLLYDSIDQSLYYQYTTLLSNQKIGNKSAEKRTNNRNKNKNNSINKDINEEKFSTIYKRILEEDKKHKQNLEKLKKNKEERDNKTYLYKPTINKKSKEITSKNKEDFYTRQKKLMEEHKRKDELLREKIRKKEKEEINKNNILLSNNSALKEGNKKERKKSVDETINKLFEWEIKRKEKLNNKIKEKDKENNLIINKPQINKKSLKIKVKRNPDKLINRLYKVDIKKRKEKQEYLNILYTPSFQPKILDKNIFSQKNVYRNRNKDKNKNLSKQNINTLGCKLNNTEKIENGKKEEENEEDFYLNFNNIIRERIFSRTKKDRNRSAMKFNIVTDDQNQYGFNETEYNYNPNNSFKRNQKPKISSSFVIRKKKKIHY